MTVEKEPSQGRHIHVPDLDDLDVAATLAAADRAVTDRHEAEVRALLVDLHFAVLCSGPPAPQEALSVRRDGRTKLVQLGGEGTPKVQDLPVCELAVARQVPVSAARRHLAGALDLAHRLPRTWTLLREGRGEVWVARRAAWTTRHLPLTAMPGVDAALAGAIDESAGRLLAILEAEVIRADPEGQQAKDAEERRHRCLVIGQSDEHGLRQIFGRIDAGDAAWLDAMLERVADALLARPDLIRDLGDDPTRDELRAEAMGWLAHPDAVVELLAGRYPPPAPDAAESDAAESDVPEPDAPDAPQPPSSPEPTRQKAVVHAHLAADAVAGLLSRHGVARVEELGPMLAEQLARLLRHARVDLKPVIDLNTGRSVNGYEHPADVKERGLLRTCGDVFPHARPEPPVRQRPRLAVRRARATGADRRPQPCAARAHPSPGQDAPGLRDHPAGQRGLPVAHAARAVATGRRQRDPPHHRSRRGGADRGSRRSPRPGIAWAPGEVAVCVTPEVTAPGRARRVESG